MSTSAVPAFEKMTDGASLAASGRSRRPPASATLRLYRRFQPYLARERLMLAAAAVCMLGVAVMEVLRPWPVKFIFDVLLLAKPHTDATTRVITQLFGTGEFLLAAATGAILAIALLGSLLAYGQAVLLAGIGRRVITSIRHDLYRHLLRLSQSFHDNASVGDLLARLTGDVRLVRDLLVTSGLYMAGRTLVLIATIGVMTAMDWRLTLVAVVVLPLLLVCSVSFAERIKVAARRQRKTESRVTHVMAENFEAIRVIQAHAREDFEDERFRDQNASSAAEELETVRLEASLERLVDVLLALGTCGVLWFGVARVQAGALSPGDLLVFTAYLASLYKPVRKISSLTSRRAKATACGERILALLDREPEIVDDPQASEIGPMSGRIVFKGVTFGYGPGREVLRNANLTIEPGEVVALVSPSGTGKSTIAHLLLRFYEPSAGTISIGDKEIRSYRLAALRDQVTVLLQDAVLFNATVRDNIAYGKIEATDAEVVAASKAAQAHDFIAALPDGYQTVIGRRGISLSGGQRQRIAIARALIRTTPIVILDEPAIGLDDANSDALMVAVRNLVAGRTCIIITHDASVARMADRIFDVKEGGIVERLSERPAEVHR